VPQKHRSSGRREYAERTRKGAAEKGKGGRLPRRRKRRRGRRDNEKVGLLYSEGPDGADARGAREGKAAKIKKTDSHSRQRTGRFDATSLRKKGWRHRLRTSKG